MGISNIVKVTILCIYLLSVTAASNLNIFKVDERFICGIKKSCLHCLQLAHCTWCPTKNQCFSEQLPHFEKYCEKEKIRHPNYEMSLEDNAKCACADGELENNCRPPGVTGPECSGRGTCKCGRCFCNVKPDPEHPSKTIMGEHCEYDNFLCDDPKCNEGPYSIYDIIVNENDNEGNDNK